LTTAGTVVAVVVTGMRVNRLGRIRRIRSRLGRTGFAITAATTGNGKTEGNNQGTENEYFLHYFGVKLGDKTFFCAFASRKHWFS
jgi:hypothetical protein